MGTAGMLYVVVFSLFILVQASPSPISDCGQYDDDYVTYTMTTDIPTVATTCVELFGSNVVFDGQWFALTNANTGIVVHGSNVTIQNLVITGGDAGISCPDCISMIISNTIIYSNPSVSASSNVVTAITLTNNTLAALDFTAMMPNATITLLNNSINAMGTLGCCDLANCVIAPGIMRRDEENVRTSMEWE